jgi:hypothetical protein
VEVALVGSFKQSRHTHLSVCAQVTVDAESAVLSALAVCNCLFLQLKMLQGVLPSMDLLQQHGLTHYLVFREAMQNGDVGLFQRSMQVCHF